MERAVGNQQPASKAKVLARRFVVATSVGPFFDAYVLIYRILIRYACWWFRRKPGTTAVYLVRGSTNRIVPGISDIDLRVVGDWTPQQRERIAREYRSLRKWIPLYDPTVPGKLENPETVWRQYEIDPWDRYSLWEGRHVWKLLWGSDVVSALPDLSAPQRQSALYTYAKWWWMVFANDVLDGHRAAIDPAFTRSLCAKAVAELFRTESLRRGWNPISRDQALSKEAERSETGSYLRRLNDFLQSGYGRFEGDLLQETTAFLPRCAAALCSRMREDPDFYETKRISIEFDNPPAERFHSALESAAVQKLKDYVVSHWEGAPKISETAGIAFVMDQIVLVISAAELPDYGRIIAFNRFRESACAVLRREITCYVRLDDVLLQLHAPDRGRSWQAILTNAANPETLAALTDPPASRCVGWSQAVEDFLRLEITLFSEALDSPAAYKANSLDFLRMFWKYLQMIIVDRTARQGTALFPQTVPAVRRGLGRIGAAQSPFLVELERAYFALLDGESRDLGWMQAAAVDYLKEVRSARAAA